jgi:SPX domain protein involved in polyphosphate accumulation
MKFGVHLLANLTPEWNSQYIQYEYMKELLDKAVAAAPIVVDGDDNSESERYFIRASEAFLDVRTIILHYSISIHFFHFS